MKRSGQSRAGLTEPSADRRRSARAPPPGASDPGGTSTPAFAVAHELRHAAVGRVATTGTPAAAASIATRPERLGPLRRHHDHVGGAEHRVHVLGEAQPHQPVLDAQRRRLPVEARPAWSDPRHLVAGHQPTAPSSWAIASANTSWPFQSLIRPMQRDHERVRGQPELLAGLPARRAAAASRASPSASSARRRRARELPSHRAARCRPARRRAAAAAASAATARATGRGARVDLAHVDQSTARPPSHRAADEHHRGVGVHQRRAAVGDGGPARAGRGATRAPAARPRAIRARRSTARGWTTTSAPACSSRSVSGPGARAARTPPASAPGRARPRSPAAGGPTP